MTDDEGAEVADQYWAARPTARSRPSERRFLYRGELLNFAVDTGVFSSHGLDPGTALLIENLGLGRADRVLDLGCGWGAVGVAAAKSSPEGHVVLTDVNRRAARLARENLARNRILNGEVRVGPFFAPVEDERFDVIATNPPYRIGREEILRILSEAPGHLLPGGRLLLVGKGSEGIRFYQEWLREHWTGTVSVLGRGSGYRVLEARLPGTGKDRERPGASAPGPTTAPRGGPRAPAGSRRARSR